MNYSSFTFPFDCCLDSSAPLVLTLVMRCWLEAFSLVIASDSSCFSPCSSSYPPPIREDRATPTVCPISDGLQEATLEK